MINIDISGVLNNAIKRGRKQKKITSKNLKKYLNVLKTIQQQLQELEKEEEQELIFDTSIAKQMSELLSSTKRMENMLEKWEEVNQNIISQLEKEKNKKELIDNKKKILLARLMNVIYALRQDLSTEEKTAEELILLTFEGETSHAEVSTEIQDNQEKEKTTSLKGVLLPFSEFISMYSDYLSVGTARMRFKQSITKELQERKDSFFISSMDDYFDAIQEASYKSGTLSKSGYVAENKARTVFTGEKKEYSQDSSVWYRHSDISFKMGNMLIGITVKNLTRNSRLLDPNKINAPRLTRTVGLLQDLNKIITILSSFDKREQNKEEIEQQLRSIVNYGNEIFKNILEQEMDNLPIISS